MITFILVDVVQKINVTHGNAFLLKVESESFMQFCSVNTPFDGNENRRIMINIRSNHTKRALIHDENSDKKVITR